MTAGPAARLLAAFCTLAESLAGDRVGCEVHGGRFAPAELERFAMNAPAVRAGCLAVAGAAGDGPSAVILDLQLAAVVVGRRTAKDEPQGAQARRLADRICFELAREQADSADGSLLWSHACFSAEELDPSRTDSPRGRDIGDPREIRAANLYTGELDKKPVAMWAVTWLQQFRALPQDFDIPLPEPAVLPDTLRSGVAPDIGQGHEDDYDTLAEPSPGSRLRHSAARSSRLRHSAARSMRGLPGEVVRASIDSAPGHVWYSRFRGENIGNASGDLQLNANMSVERVAWFRGLGQLEIRGFVPSPPPEPQQAGQYRSYFGPGGPGEGKALYLQPTGLDSPIVLPFGDRVASLGKHRVGLAADLASLEVDDAYAAALTRIGEEHLAVELVIADAPVPEEPA